MKRMKRMTKFEMAKAIERIKPWNPVVIYWDKFTWPEVKEEYNRVVAREEARDK